MTFVASTHSPRVVLDTVTTTKPPSLDEINDTITSLPPIPYFHPLFNKRHIFPLTLSPTFDWFFDTLPADFKQRYPACVHDLEALDTFFWEAYRNMDRSRNPFTVIYQVTIQASVFDSFVKEMEKFCSTTTRNGAFVLPITRICGDLMEWGRRYNNQVDFPHKDVNEAFHCYHRHFFVAVQHGFQFIGRVLDNIREPPYVRCGTFPVQLLLKLKAFNSVPVTRLTDLLKVCSVRQYYDNGKYDDNSDDYVIERLDMPPVHRDDSF